MRLLQLTDLHLRADPEDLLRGVATFETLRRCIDRAMAQQAYDGILLSGDLVQDEPLGYRHLTTLLGRFGLPTLCLPGNHDEPAALREALGNEPFSVLGHLKLGAGVLIGLDSTIAGAAGGILSDSELRRLDECLTEHAPLPAVVALHHPPVAMGSAWLDEIGLAEPERFWAVIERHPQVRAVLFGHAHQAHRSRRGSVEVIGAPATCLQFRPNSHDFAVDDAPPGWHVLTLAANGEVSSRFQWLGPN